MEKIEIYTDGSSLGNPGPGGWGTVILFHQKDKTKSTIVEIGGSEKQTTNNRMELFSVISALERLQTIDTDIKEKIVVYADSQYVLSGITSWIDNWEKNNWRTANKKEVLNQDLWKRLRSVSQYFKNISWQKVKGHAGVSGNERVDTIATTYAQTGTCALYQGQLHEYEKRFGKL